MPAWWCTNTQKEAAKYECCWHTWARAPHWKFCCTCGAHLEKGYHTMVFNDMDQAQNTKLDLIRKIESIDVQLTQRAAEVVGRVPDAKYKKYLQWKGSAVEAKQVALTELRLVKQWISKNKEKEDGKA